MIDARRHMMAICSGTAKERNGTRSHVLVGKTRECALNLYLAGVGRQNNAWHARWCRHVAEQIVHSASADLRQHRAPVVVRQRQISHASETFHELRILISGH